MIDFTNIEIAGLDKVVLYENKGIVYNYPTISDTSIVDSISTTGTTDEITNCIDTKFSRKISLGGNNKQLKDDKIQFNITNFNDDTKELLRRLQKNRNGYIVELYLLNGTTIILQDSMYFQNNSEKGFNSNNFQINLAYRVFSNKADLDKG